MPMLKDYIVKNFNLGTITQIEDRTLPKGAASDSLNWLTFGDQIELRRGSAILGDEVLGNGRISGLRVGTRFDGVQIPFRSRARKLEYYDAATLLWTEATTADILPAAVLDDDGIGEDVAFSPYHSLAGAMMYASSKNSGIYKVPIANPDAWVDQLSTNHRGKIKIKSGTMWLWDRKDTNGGFDQTGLYRSYVDKDELSDFTAVTSEAIGGSGATRSGTLAFKAAGAKRTCMFVSITDGTETFRDDRNGNLVGSAGGAGTINYATGAYSVIFAVSPTNPVTADYYWEDSTSAGICDFSKSATRTPGQGFVLRQDDGGAEMQNLGSIGADEYCLHTRKTWKTTISSDDASAANPIYRARVGTPYWRAACETGEGIYYIDFIDQNSPIIRLLTYSADGNDQIVPVSISDNIDLSNYLFDKAVVWEWGDYICVACQSSDSTYNDTLWIYSKIWKSWDRLDYRVSVLDEYGGALIAGDSISANVLTLFSGWTDEESEIPNYWISGDDLLGAEGIKVANKFVIAGLIDPDQTLVVSLLYDNGEEIEVGRIEGDGAYVDQGAHIGIGTTVMGSHEIGGGGTGEEASPYRREFRINTDRFEYVKVKFEATGIGYLSVSEYQFKDIRYRGRSLPARYVVDNS